MITLGNFNLELLSENLFYLEKRPVNHYANLHKNNICGECKNKIF